MCYVIYTHPHWHTHAQHPTLQGMTIPWWHFLGVWTFVWSLDDVNVWCAPLIIFCSQVIHSRMERKVRKKNTYNIVVIVASIDKESINYFWHGFKSIKKLKYQHIKQYTILLYLSSIWKWNREDMGEISSQFEWFSSSLSSSSEVAGHICRAMKWWTGWERFKRIFCFTKSF